jgi:hypothetical protein
MLGSNLVTIVTRSEVTKDERKYNVATPSDAKQKFLRHHISKKILLERGTEKGFLFVPLRNGSSLKTRNERAVMKSLEREEYYLPLLPPSLTSKRSTFTASNEKPRLEVT